MKWKIGIHRLVLGCIVLLVSLLNSMNVKAIDVNSAESLRNAINRGESYIRLTSDIKVGKTNNPFTINSGNITINLNGKKVTNGTWGVINYVTLIFKVTGGTLTLEGNGLVDGESLSENTIEVTGGTLKVKSTIYSDSKNAIVINGSNASVEILEGANVYSDGRYTAISLTNGNLSFQGGTINQVNGNNSIEASGKMLSDFVKKGYGIYVNNSLANMSASSVKGSLSVGLITYQIGHSNTDNAAVTGNWPKEYNVETPTFSILETASKDYYDFQGWRLDNTVNKTITIPKGSTGNKTLTAVWKGKEYNIHYNLNGGENSVNNKPTYTYSAESAVPLSDPTRSYYSFENWYKDPSFTDPFGKEIPKGQSGELKLYAKWKADSYAVKFYDGNVELTEYAKSRSVEKGISASEMPKPSKDGYVFLHWANNGQKITFVPAGHEPLSLTAQWTEVSYIVKYEPKDETKLPDESYTKATVSDHVWKTEEHVKKDGYVFKGWFLESDFSGEPLRAFPLNVELGDVSPDKTVVTYTFYVKWELKDYSIVFADCEGVDNKKYNINKGVSKDDMPKPDERKGFKFKGWYNNDRGPIESIEKGTGDVYLKAKWDPIEYTIKYVTNGGTLSGEMTKYTIEKPIELKTPTRDNYTFAGWYTDSQFNNRVEGDVLSQEYGDKIFYAKWSPKTYKLTFNPTGGRISQTEQNYIYGEVTEFARQPYKDHYKFDGWYYDEACTKAYGSKIAADNSGDHTLYAKWKLEDYKIVLDSYNGEFLSGANVPTTYTYESTIEKLPEPIRQGFTFAGWYADDLLTKPVSSPVIKKGESGDKKFYATWDRGYQVIFTQPANGKITVSWNGSAVSPGTMIGKGESLTVSAEATNVNYELKQILINGKPFTSSPQLVTMPKEDLKITAEFTEASTPAAPAPEIIITPSGVDKFPKGEDVKVQLKKTDESTTLYYNLAGVEKKYEKEFVVASAQDTVLLKAIARKQGLRDGVNSRYIIFDNGKITLTFNLPLGVKAVNPSGGEVVTATTTGGSFEFELKVDREYYTNLDSMVVSANDSVIKAGSAGLYTLTNCTSDVTVTVSGLKAKVCNVTLQQTDNGTISFTDGAEETTMEVEYGTSVSVTAKADEDFKFLQWSTGSQSNPLKLTVDKDTTISARFINDYKAYAITLPQLEGVTVRPFTGYSTEVKKDGTFKFYLKLADGYREENPVVRANGEVLAKNKGGYAIYKVNKNISISVEGIVRESVTMKVPGNVNAKVVETMSNASKQEVYEETMILLHAEAPAGKIFDKWTDGKTDNPRMVPAVDAEQLHPLFTNKGDAAYAKVILNQSPGAGITAVNANIDGVKTGETVQLNVVLLPAYSQSEVTLTVDDEVLKPSVSLRAASETKTYMYSLPVKKDEITVKVSGMKLNTYNVSLAQTDGGVVYSNPAGTATHGDKIQLKAQPEPGMLFVKWWDGNTLNPYPYTVTADTEVKASFLGAESTVDNESIRKDDPIEITTDGNRLSIKVDKEYQVYIYNFGGGLYQKRKIPAGEYSMYLPNGEYLIKVGDKVDKVIIR